ncbi:GAF and ANTAR domain-containing protein [Streptomyces sp. NPDC046853]|uniref:GAF and ANTAR domain-containing protein n=1 Tax=Streptomyces sp. NPDC046853 TaxID=3154920 RepID=UPI0033EA08F8
MRGGELTDFLDGLHQVARDGGDLSAAGAADAARLLHLDALTLSLYSARGVLELLWADRADPLGTALEDVQYTLGEGPTLDAARDGCLVTETDLSAAPADRWPLFTSAACRTPARSVIAIPLFLGLATVGVLTGYRTTPGPFPTGQRQDLARFAGTALDLLLRTPPQSLASGTDGPALHRATVHQAAGILSVHLGMTINESLLRMRAHAWRHDLPLLHVAHDITTGHLHFDPED